MVVQWWSQLFHSCLQSPILHLPGQHAQINSHSHTHTLTHTMYIPNTNPTHYTHIHPHTHRADLPPTHCKENCSTVLWVCNLLIKCIHCLSNRSEEETIIWQSHDNHMTITWQSHDNYMTVLIHTGLKSAFFFGSRNIGFWLSILCAIPFA